MVTVRGDLHEKNPSSAICGVKPWMGKIKKNLVAWYVYEVNKKLLLTCLGQKIEILWQEPKLMMPRL